MTQSNYPSSCVVISNYNGRKRGFLSRCLGSLSRNLKIVNQRSLPLQIILIDDNSQDDSVKILKEFRDKEPLGQVEVLTTPNIGVTATMNYGIRHVFDQYSGCQFLMTLDNDTAIDDNFLEIIVGKARLSHERTGMFASNQFMLYDFPKKREHRSTGHYVTKAGSTLDRDFKDKEKTRGKTIIGPCLSGALLKTAMLEEIGLIPEKYFHYNNCSELAFRAQLSNWRVEFVPSAVMWHNWRPQSEITPKQKQNREITRIWNILRFFPKEKIDKALKDYRKEKFATSPTEEEKKRYIEEAKESCPETSCNNKKKEVYRKFIDR